MNRGPSKNSRAVGLSFVEKAAAAWGEPLPDWIDELARLADRDGLSGPAKRINYSTSVISSVLNNKYGKGDIACVEEMVRGSMMALMVNCPMLGELGRDRCLDWQRKPYAATSSHRVQMFRACQTCPNRRQT